MKTHTDLQEYRAIINAAATVVIPAYNEEVCIEDCILSVRSQSFTPLEIIVIDDGSTDRTAIICKALGIKVLHQDHKGPSAARNLGISVATGNIIVFVDADMVLTDSYVEVLICPIIEGEAVATSGWDEEVLNWGNPWARCQTWYSNLPHRRRQPIVPPEGEAVYRAVRKDFFMAAGGLAEKRGRGGDVFIAMKTGVMAKVVRGATCYHRNAENACEILRESLWRGRTVLEGQRLKLRRALVALAYENLFLSIVKGIILAIKKREPYMPLYAIAYSVGFTLGVIQALVCKRYTK